MCPTSPAFRYKQLEHLRSGPAADLIRNCSVFEKLRVVHCGHNVKFQQSGVQECQQQSPFHFSRLFSYSFISSYKLSNDLTFVPYRTLAQTSCGVLGVFILSSTETETFERIPVLQPWSDNRFIELRNLSF